MADETFNPETVAYIEELRDQLATLQTTAAYSNVNAHAATVATQADIDEVNRRNITRSAPLMTLTLESWQAIPAAVLRDFHPIS